MTRRQPIKKGIPIQSEKHVICKGLGDKLLTTDLWGSGFLSIYPSLNILSTCDG